MKCKDCKREIPDDCIYCPVCGEKQIRDRRKREEIKVPKPVELPSGSWRIQLKAEGQSVTEATPELCITRAKAIRAGFLEKKSKSKRMTLYKAMSDYIESRNAVLSPSTILNYKKIQRNHFKRYHDADIAAIQWQRAVNDESRFFSPKTVRNAYGLVASTLRFLGLPVPTVKLPAKESRELPWLDYSQIQTFLTAIRGDKCEIAALLELHSLRRSEMLAVTPSKVDKDGIHVDGSIVYSEDGLVRKRANKTAASKRVVPIMIPRLQELFDEFQGGPDDPYVTISISTVYRRINEICDSVGLPRVGNHGLRRTYASLAYHLKWPEREAMRIGGWDDLQTMHKIYVKLSESDISQSAEKMREFYKGLE